MGGVGTFAKWGLVCAFAFIFSLEEMGTPSVARAETKKKAVAKKSSKKNTISKNSKKKSSPLAAEEEPYLGPLRLFVYDFDYNLAVDETSVFRVFRWQTHGSPLFDLASAGDIPEFIDVPMRDWEQGVRSDIQPYDQFPVKYLVGRYDDGAMSVANPGNSYYDKPIRLSNGQELNPRFYYIDPIQTYRAFRTPSSGNMPLIEAVGRMAETRRFGPLFPLFRLSSRPELPVASSILTYRGHSDVEWAAAKELLINSGDLAAGSLIDRVYALSNPRLMVSDATSVSQFNEPNISLADLKVKILNHLIQEVLLRRMDRELPENPRPNVLVYADDDISILLKVRALFERSTRAVLDFDRHMNRAQPPLRLILLNTAPPWLYAPVPSLQQHNPSALAGNPVDLAQVMVFDSNYRMQRGGEAVKMYNGVDTVTQAVSLAFGVSEQTAKKALGGKMDCRKLLIPPQMGEGR